MYLLVYFLFLGLSNGESCEPRVEVTTASDYTILWGNQWIWPNGLFFRATSNGAAGFYFAREDTMIVNGAGQEGECYWIVLLAGGPNSNYPESEISYVCDDWNAREILDRDSVQRIFSSDERFLFHISYSNGLLRVAEVNENGFDWFLEMNTADQMTPPPSQEQVGISTEAGFSGVWKFCDDSKCDTNLQLCNSGSCSDESFTYSCTCDPPYIGRHCELLPPEEEVEQVVEVEEEEEEEEEIEAPSPSPTESPTAFTIEDCLSPNSLDITWNFENGNIEGWTASGTAFSEKWLPIKGNSDLRLANPEQKVHSQGDWWVGSFNKAAVETICPMENGFCVLPNGGDQNAGVVKLDNIDGNTAEQQQSCLERCLAYSGATGCEVIWDRDNRGCYVHTNLVDRGNGVIRHQCWIFSKCSRELNILHEKAECGTTEQKYLGVYQNPMDCAFDVIHNSQCTDNVFMWSPSYPSWGCRCCAKEYPDGPVKNQIWDVYSFTRRDHWPLDTEHPHKACDGNELGRDPSCDGDLECCKSSQLARGYKFVVWWRDQCWGSPTCDPDAMYNLETSEIFKHVEFASTGDFDLETVYENHECGTSQIKNLGQVQSPESCSAAVQQDQECTDSMFMYSSVTPELGCWCCGIPDAPIQHELWNVYDFGYGLPEWTLLLRQTTPFYTSVADWTNGYGSSSDDDNYSILDSDMESYRGDDGKFTFKLVWPRRTGHNHHTWKQSSNPLTSKVAGYEGVEIFSTAERWGGLEYNGHVSVMDGSVNHGHWWYAVGATQSHGGGIPGPAHVESQTELWVLTGGSHSANVDGNQGEVLKGSLTSLQFCINTGTIGMLVGGGCDSDNTYVAVEIEDVPINTFRATGRCDESMEYVEFDVTEHASKKAVIKIVDDSSGPWGHINVDDIVFFWQGFDKLRYLGEEIPCITPRYVETTWNFESGKLDGWSIKGGRGVFANQPVHSSPFGHTSNHEGKHWIGSTEDHVPEWTIVMRQTVPFYADSAHWQSGFNSPTDDNFSILDQLESYKGNDGKFTFKIVWPKSTQSKNYNIWKQTSNPLHSTTISGYEVVEIHHTNNGWGGLQKNGAQALMDGSVGGNWWYAVGSRAHHNGGIPGGSSVVELQTELWVLSGSHKTRPRGYLVSQEFCITEGSISMLVGGPEDSGVALLLADTNEIVNIANGKNIDKMSYKKWDVEEHINKMAYIRIFDYSDEWGHVNVDNFQFFWDGFEMNFYSSWCLQTTMPEREIQLNDETVTRRCIEVKPKKQTGICDLCSTQPFIDSLVRGNSGLVFTLASQAMNFVITLTGDGEHMAFGIPEDRGDCINPGFTTSYSIIVGNGRLMIKESGTGALKKTIVVDYKAGDQCSIEIRKGKLIYVKDGKVLYVSVMPIKLPLNYKLHYDSGNSDALYLCPLKYTAGTKACIPPDETITSWDFENGLLGWTSFMDGTAFNFQPTFGDNIAARNDGRSNHQGDWWIGGLEHYQNDDTTTRGTPGDNAATGGIRSMDFCITQNRISFLIGGGKVDVYVRLVIDDKLAVNNEKDLLSTGKNNEQMVYTVWETNDLIGQIGHIEIVDMSHLHHINVDDFRFWGNCATEFDGQKVTCAKLRGREDCLSHRNPRHDSNCVLCVDDDANPTPCLDRNGTPRPDNAECLAQDFVKFNPQNKYEIASCEAGSYLGPLDAFPRSLTITGSEIKTVTFLLGTSDVGTWPTSSVKCCLDYEGIRTADVIPVGADKCCWHMSQSRSEETIAFQTKKDLFDQLYSGTVKAVCQSEDPLFCNLEKVFTITGRADPPPPPSGARCHGTGDPHYNDFKGVWFDWQAKSNVWFVKTLDQEWNVQTRLKCCTPWARGTCRVTCSEAVVMTYRNGKVTLNIPPPAGAIQISPQSFGLIKLVQSGNSYKMTANNGATCSVGYKGNANFRYFNVYANTISAYANNLAPMSLCGDGKESRDTGTANAIPKRGGKDNRFDVDPSEDYFYTDPQWQPPVEGAPPLITLQACEEQLQDNVCEEPPTCCDCDDDSDCQERYPHLECCKVCCPMDICCLHPERCCEGDDCDPDPPTPAPPCYEPSVFPCYDLTSTDRRLLMDTPCCYKEMSTPDKPFSTIEQNPPPDGFDTCCREPDDCTKQCKELFEIDSLTTIMNKPGCDCELINTTITEQMEACLLDGGQMGCKIIGEILAPTITKIIEITLEKCIYEFGPDCDPCMPPECDLKGPNVMHYTDDSVDPPLCWCECKTPYFGPRCLREDSPYCSNVVSNELGVVTLEGDFFYESDELMCVYTMGGQSYQAAATGISTSIVCDGTVPDIGDSLCRYAQIRCNTPPHEWIISNYNSFFGLTIVIEVKGTTLNPNEDDTPALLTQEFPCEYNHQVTCTDLLTSMGWPDSNPCDRNNNYIAHNLDEVIDPTADNYDFCCSNTPPPTPAPTNSPTPSPTNSPTWPPHIVVPVIELHTPWYFDFTPPPTANTVDYDAAETPTNVYVPASRGSMRGPYCLGFGDECLPIYGEY